MRRILVIAMLAACQPHPKSADVDPLGFGDEVQRLTVTQRGIHTVPDTVGRLAIELGDVEGRDRVERVAVIDHKDEGRALTARTLRVGDEREFSIDGTRYRLKLVETDSAHVVNDTATFELWLGR